MLQAIEGSIARRTHVDAFVLVVLGGRRGSGHGNGGRGDGVMWITCNFDHRIVRNRGFGTRGSNRHRVERRQRGRRGGDRQELGEGGWQARKSLAKFSPNLGILRRRRCCRYKSRRLVANWGIIVQRRKNENVQEEGKRPGSWTTTLSLARVTAARFWGRGQRCWEW